LVLLLVRELKLQSSISPLFESINSFLGKWGIRVGLITGSIIKNKKKEILDKLASGEIDIIIGTHALIQENVQFNNLSLVITDEQHRFGVRQRAELINKGHNPHVLVMTATPIPRTLALFLYGDMDISIINEMPKGRQKISTHFVKASGRDKIYHSLIKEIQKGRQIYVVCPLVEESENLQVESAVETEKNLKEKYFMNFRVGLLHGRMTSREKDEVMHCFKAGNIDVLVSTTVIEVGVNVPNATVMVIENADRFGLAQLHQLRGRVGRGINKSYCILISEAKSQIAIDRMKIMTSTGDGFVIAEKDMEMRGTGEFFGIRQHGLPELKMADIVKDIEILKETRDLAREIIEKNYLNLTEYSLLLDSINKIFNEKAENITFN
jgi:ATP-dependent DNA helicase RecG